MKGIMKEIYYPELKFVRFCGEKYGINRGIYNVIDEWFYEKGVVDIVKRRKLIVDYLEDLNHSSHEIKFRSGGVKRSLQVYIDKQMPDESIVDSTSILKI